MARKRKQYSGAFKFRVALAAAKGEQTLNEVASTHSVHPNQVSTWKKQLLTEGASVFESRRPAEQQAAATREAELYEQIGRLQMELAWLKKKAAPFE